MRIRTLLLTCLLSLGSIFSYAQKINVNRVDPPSWWTGMHDHSLQLLVYGSRISETRPVINYPGVQIEQTTLVKSPDYLFLDLVISSATKPGTFTIHFKKGKKDIVQYAYTLNKRNKNPKLHHGFDNSDVIYLLMPDRFANGDTTNDNMPGMLEKANVKNPTDGTEEILKVLKSIWAI